MLERAELVVLLDDDDRVREPREVRQQRVSEEPRLRLLLVGHVVDAEDDLVRGAVRAGALSRSSSSSCLLYTSPSPRDGLLSRMPSSA